MHHKTSKDSQPYLGLVDELSLELLQLLSGKLQRFVQLSVSCRSIASNHP